MNCAYPAPRNYSLNPPSIHFVFVFCPSGEIKIFIRTSFRLLHVAASVYYIIMHQHHGSLRQFLLVFTARVCSANRSTKSLLNTHNSLPCILKGRPPLYCQWSRHNFATLIGTRTMLLSHGLAVITVSWLTANKPGDKMPWEHPMHFADGIIFRVLWYNTWFYVALCRWTITI